MFNVNLPEKVFFFFLNGANFVKYANIIFY